MIVQVRHVLQGGDDAAASYAGALVFQPLNDRGLRTGDAEQELGDLLRLHRRLRRSVGRW
jgi:hypothetical protein